MKESSQNSLHCNYSTLVMIIAMKIVYRLKKSEAAIFSNTLSVFLFVFFG